MQIRIDPNKRVSTQRRRLKAHILLSAVAGLFASTQAYAQAHASPEVWEWQIDGAQLAAADPFSTLVGKSKSSRRDVDA